MRLLLFVFSLATLAACALSHERPYDEVGLPLDAGGTDAATFVDAGSDGGFQCSVPGFIRPAGLNGAEGTGVVSSIDGRTVVVTLTNDLDAVFTWVSETPPPRLAVGDMATVTRNGAWSRLSTSRTRVDVYSDGAYTATPTTTVSPSNGSFSLVERCRVASSRECGEPVVYDLAFGDTTLRAGESAWAGCDGGGEIVFGGAAHYPGCTVNDNGLVLAVEGQFDWTFGVSCVNDDISVD